MLSAAIPVEFFERIDQLLFERCQPARRQPFEQAAERAQLIGADAAAALPGQVQRDAGLTDRGAQFGERSGGGMTGGQ